MTIAENWAHIRGRVDAACARAKRSPSDVTLIAVSKVQPASAIREAYAAGARAFGENYAQELTTKRAELEDLADLQWHFIGRLQRNKAKFVAGNVALVHAVDTVDVAEALGKRAAQAVLLAVNVADEATKGGTTSDGAVALARSIAALPGISLQGLMTMPPPSEDPDAARPVFTHLAQLRDRIADALGTPLPVLSMGMSGDFEVAIECGATHVRVGTAIFGARQLQ
ncbi:YggS family pyridoxal phosphate-dependent enzyme [soil metagenome]